MGTYNHVLTASEFRKRGFRLLAELRESYDPFCDDEHRIVITHRGRTAAIVSPVAKGDFGSLAHLFTYIGDIEPPIDLVWDAMREDGPVWGKGVGWTMDDNEPRLLIPIIRFLKAEPAEMDWQRR